MNSRLDEIQAAILRARLSMLPGWTTRRRALAAAYRRALVGAPVTVPPERDPGHVYHLFPVLTPASRAFQAHLADRGIGTLVHYPVPLPHQPALAAVRRTGECPVANRVANEVCSLPLHPGLSDADVPIVAERSARSGRADRTDRPHAVFLGIVGGVILGYLPGAVIFRLPIANRPRRAALAAEERVFWQVMISIAWSLALVLAMAAVGVYRYERLLAVNVAVTLALIAVARTQLFWRGTQAKVTIAVLVPLTLLGLGIWRFFPAAEYMIGGKDPGVYINEGFAIARTGQLFRRDAVVRQRARIRARPVLSDPIRATSTTACDSWASSSTIPPPAR